MNIEKIIRSWKADEDNWETSLVASPVGQGLTEEEMLEVSGGACPFTICPFTCELTCPFTCGTAITVPVA